MKGHSPWPKSASRFAASRAVLAFNQHAQVQTHFGPFYEAITTVREPCGGTVVAAADYATMAYPARQRAALGFRWFVSLEFYLR